MNWRWRGLCKNVCNNIDCKCERKIDFTERRRSNDCTIGNGFGTLNSLTLTAFSEFLHGLDQKRAFMRVLNYGH